MPINFSHLFASTNNASENPTNHASASHDRQPLWITLRQVEERRPAFPRINWLSFRFCEARTA